MKQPLSYYSWPIAIVGFFLLLAAGNVQLYVLANDAHQGSQLLEANAYESGLQYQERLNAFERLRKAGLHVDVKIDAQTEQRELAVRLNDVLGKPVSARNIRAHAIYAASREHDQTFTLDGPDAEGMYRAPFDSLSGVYLLTLEIESTSGEMMLFETRISGR